MISTLSINNSVNAVNSKKLSFLEYLFVFVIVIYAGRGNIYFASLSIIKYPFWISIPIILSGIMALKWRLEFTANFYLLILLFFTYFIGITVKYNEIRPTFFLNYALLFFIAYVAVRVLHVNLFRIFELIIFYLAIVGLIFFVIQIILRGDNFFNLINKIPGISQISNVTGNGLNAIIYSIQPANASIQYNSIIPRNCGFAWEPGGFAVFLSLAIYTNLFINTSDKNSRKRFWWLLIALLSTQSTTGYLIFVIIIIFYYLNKKIDVILLLLPLLIVALFLLFTLPFMSNKIISYVNEAKEVDIIVERTIGGESSVAPQRFTSFMIALRDFKSNPILGIGGMDEERWTYKIGANVSTISGIGNLLANFGIIGFLFFFITSYYTSGFFSKHFNYRGNFLFFLIFIFIAISYSIILLPVFMSFWMFKLFVPKRITSDNRGDEIPVESDLNSATT